MTSTPPDVPSSHLPDPTPLPAAGDASPPPATASATFTRGWTTALIQGALAFAIMASLGQAIAFAAYVASGGDVPAGTVAKIGWLYFGVFHHVAVVVTLANFNLGSLLGSVPGGASVRGLSYHVGLALMLATGLAVFLLYRAGREVANRAGGGPVERAFHGMKVAPAYAIPSLLLSALIAFHVRTPAGLGSAAELKIQSSLPESLVFPLFIAAVAGAAGGFLSDRERLLAREAWGGRALGALAGGWRMFVLGLLLSFAGLLVLAVVEPDSAKAYFDAVSRGSAVRTAVIVGHHVLLLPNQSMWVLVPAMGGCDSAAAAGFRVTLLCYWKYPRSLSVSPESALGLASGVPRSSFHTGVAPVGYFLFLLVPLLSVFLGGRVAARRSGSRSMGDGGAAGAAAGVVFAVLVVIGGLFSEVGFGVSGSFGGIGGGGAGRVGPDVLLGGLLALAWGVVGGWVGGRYELRGATPAEPAPSP